MRLVTPTAISPSTKKGPAPRGAGPFGVLDGGVLRRLILLGLCLVCLPALAGQSPETAVHPGPLPFIPEEDLRLDAVRLTPVVRLEPILASEILPDDLFLAVPEGRWSPGGLDFGSRPFESTIVRTLPGVWWMRLRDERALDDMDVRLELTSGDGTHNRLVHESDQNSQIHVTVEPLAPVVALDDTSSVVIEGGAVLILDISDVRSAGSYSGTLTVTIDRF